MSPDTTDLCEAASLLLALDTRQTLTYEPAFATKCGQAWRQRAIARLEQRLEHGLNPSPTPSSEQMALALLKDAGHELQQASEALVKAAEALKYAGKGQAANATIQAASRAQRAATGLTG